MTQGSHPIMKTLTTVFALAIYLVTLTQGAIAADAADPSEPSSLVRSLFADYTKELRDNEKLYSEHSDQLLELANKRLAPYFNFERMAQIAMAKYWLQASEEQKQAVTEQFKRQLIRNYAQTLFAYRKSDIDIVNEDVHSATKHTVKVKVKDDQGTPVTLFIRFEKRGQQWQAVDINVEGVSIVVTARSQFSEVIDKSGIDGLIESLTKENQSKS